YAVDQSLIGRRVELRFDPEDLTRLDVFWEGRHVGQAIPFTVGHHVQRQAPQAEQTPPPPSAGGAYLELIVVEQAPRLLVSSAHHVIDVATPTVGARGLYLTIAHALGARPRAQKAELIAQAQTLLAAEEHERRRRVVFIIDEAHLLAPDQLEELRPLTNAEMD